MLNNNRVCKFLTKNPLKMEHDLQMHNIYRIQYAKMHCNSIVFTRLKVLQKRPKIREKTSKNLFVRKHFVRNSFVRSF